MGYKPDIARQAAFQFMKINDPRVSMLKRFTKAMGVDEGLTVITARFLAPGQRVGWRHV